MARRRSRRFRRAVASVSSLAAALLLSAGCQTTYRPPDDLPASTPTDSAAAAHRELDQGEAPRWVRYPPTGAGMLYGVGSAPTHGGDQAQGVQKAKERARADLLKQLHVLVSGETEVSASRVIQGGNTQMTRKLREAVYTQIPKTKLTGVDVEEVYVDRANFTAWALVKLDRERAAANLRDEISDLDREIARYVEVPTTLPKHEQLERILPALAAMAKRDQIEARLRLIAGGTAPPTSPEEVVLNRRINDLLNSLIMVLRPQGKAARDIEPYLLKYLTGKGLSVASSGKADISLVYELQTRDTVDGDRYFSFAQGNIQVKDARAETVRSVDARAKGVSGVSAAQARSKAVEQLGERLGEAVQAGFINKIQQGP